jgi:hypothetical protein
MVNITNEQGNHRERILSKMVEQKEEKPRFQQIVDLSTPTTRMQMIQLGLNPFSAEDINHFKAIQKEGAELSRWSRFKAACALFFLNKVNDDLELLALKRLNAKLPTEDNAIIAPSRAQFSEFVMPEPTDGAGKVRAAFTERVVKAPPFDYAEFPDMFEYQSDIIKGLKEREAGLNKMKEEISKLPKNFEAEEFIPGVVPTVFETPKGKQPIAMKKGSKRVKIKQDLSKATKVEHLRGTGKKVKIDIKPKKSKPQPVMLTKGKPKKRK